jgi:PrsW family intramembrane metalloprotease
MNSSRSHIPSLLSALLFIVGALTFFSVALLMAVTALGTFFAGDGVGAQQTIVMTVSAFQALILTGAAIIAIQRFRESPFAAQDASFNVSARHVIASLFLAAAALFIGYQIVKSETANWLVLPVLTLPAVVLPLFVMLGLGIRGIPLGTRWQSWNVFGLAMTLAPFILVFLELFAMLVIVVVVVVVLMSQPGFEAQVQWLSMQIYGLDPQSTAAQDLIAPYLLEPGVISVSLVYFAMIVPLLEELFKPLGVWLFANKLTSPAQGFALGALSGSAYALIETLGVSAQTTDWATLLLTRIGTGALHITSSALMGAAIVYAIRERRYLRLLATYLVSVSLHGLWNTLAVFFAFATIAEYFELEHRLREFQVPLNIGMAVLSVLLLSILVVSNQRMKATLPKPMVEESLPLERQQP